jgi:hypothetical protein
MVNSQPPKGVYVLIVLKFLLRYNKSEVISMIGIEIKNINDARAAFAAVIQDATNAKEIICQNGRSNNSEKVSIISTGLLNEILSGYRFHPEYLFDEESEEHQVLLHEISIYSYAETKEEAEEDLLDLVEDYVEQYLVDPGKYLKFEKFKKQYPYILRLAHCTGREEMRKAIFNGDM